MIRKLYHRSRTLPTPMAGLALGVATLGVDWEFALDLNGVAQIVGAIIAALLLTLLAVRYLFHFDTLINDLKHPVAGSIVPTFAMCLMALSKTAGLFSLVAAIVIWGTGLVIHLLALAAFVFHRLREPAMENMVPSWFIPPIGIIVADVTFPGIDALQPLAHVLLIVGLVSYAVMLPLMIYRIFLYPSIPSGAKPTIAIMAAPASLSLAGYLSVTPEPNFLICSLLFGIAILMTFVVYTAFWQLLRLQFSPGYAAFTFPMAIGVTALYKYSHWLETLDIPSHYVQDVRMLAHFELGVATIIISYVLILYIRNFKRF